MGTQGTGRKRSSKKEKSTAEDDALNLIARDRGDECKSQNAAIAPISGRLPLRFWQEVVSVLTPNVPCHSSLTCSPLSALLSTRLWF
ncbi:hypothetical protein EYF80_039825 [Liparis tanakae]|uniref:Uncharacterized protein n=1 Tax=Liparis tanakae TaxID=230148 RepID=A0A4Z2G8T7_9TELE|nr:hypothetical protein EYF80_039825 [Liparis tanakae]